MSEDLSSRIDDWSECSIINEFSRSIINGMTDNSMAAHGHLVLYLGAYRAVFWSGLATIAAVTLPICVPRRFALGISGACGVVALYLNFTACGWIDSLFRAGR